MSARTFAGTRHNRDGHAADKETQRLPHFRRGPDEWLPLPSGPWASAERLMRRNRLVCFGPTVQSRRIYCFRCAGYPLELSLQKPAFLRNTSQRVMTRRVSPRRQRWLQAGLFSLDWHHSSMAAGNRREGRLLGNSEFLNFPFL